MPLNSPNLVALSHQPRPDKNHKNPKKSTETYYEQSMTLPPHWKVDGPMLHPLENRIPSKCTDRYSNNEADKQNNS